MLLNKEDIMKIIPHRDPILLVDEAELTSETTLTGKFYVDPNMEIFKGHFPGNPVFPGIYSIESMGQATDIMMLSLDKYKNTVPLFYGADKIRFFKKISPGDTLELRTEVIDDNEEKRKAVCSASIYVGGEKAVSGEIAIAFR